MFKNIEVKEEYKKKLMESLLVDVREKNEFNAEHIENAINFPQSTFNSIKFSNIIKNNKNIIIYCQSGRRSLQVCEKLDNTNNCQIFNLIGGINSWKENGLNTEFRKKLMPIDRQTQIMMGIFIVFSLILSQIYSSYWLIIASIVGLGLINAGITGWCGLSKVINRMPWNKVL